MEFTQVRASMVEETHVLFVFVIDGGYTLREGLKKCMSLWRIVARESR